MKTPLHIKTVICGICLLMTTSALANDGNDTSSVGNLYEMDLAALMNVTITTAGKAEQKISDIPASVVMVSRKEIETYGYRNIEELLENIPGYYVTNDYGFQDANINVRGYQGSISRQTIIMIDGVPQSIDANSGNLLNYMNIPIETIERVEVVRGPMSVIYGSGAFFGAINIITKTETAGNTGLALVRYGSNRNIHATAKGTYNKDSVYFSALGGYEKSDGPSHKYADMMSQARMDALKLPTSWTETGKQALGYDTKFLSLESKFKHLYSNLQVKDVMFGVYNFSPQNPTFSTTVRTQDTRFTFGYNRVINNKFRLTAETFLNTTESNIKPFCYNLKPVYGNYITQSKAVTSRLDLFIKPITGLEILLGGQHKAVYYLKDNINLPGMGPTMTAMDDRLKDNSTYNVFSAYINADYNPIPKLRLTAGLRIDKQLEYIYYKAWNQASPTMAKYYEDTIPASKPLAIPRLAAIYNINDRNVIKLMYGKAIALPYSAVVMDNVSNSIVSGKKAVGNLNPEEIQTYELCYTTTPNNIFTVSTNLYLNYLNNIIERQISFSPTNVVSIIPKNTGKYTTQGLEIMTSIRPIKKLSFDIAITYQKTKNETTPAIEPMASPRLLIYGKMSYQLPDLGGEGHNQVSLGITANYVDKMESYYDFAPKSATDPSPIGRYSSTAPAYLLISPNVHVENLLIKGLFTNVKVYNALDTKYSSPATLAINWADKGLPGFGRTIQVSLGYKF